MGDGETRGNRGGGCCCPPPEGPLQDKPPCCGPPAVARGGDTDEDVPGFIGWLAHETGRIPRVSSALSLGDLVGACMVRLGIGRMRYLVPPGLYAVGNPSPDAPVIVTANYKLSFDTVRRALDGRDVWLLVLETFGVNVWCAAGKGAFGTDELAFRIERTGLDRVVSHRNLVLPILGAPGVASHQVKNRTGFSVLYGTIRADDLPDYLDNGMVTTPRMRELTFTFPERLVLIPLELILAWRSLIVAGVILFAVPAMTNGYAAGIRSLAAFSGAALTGLVVVPLFLPWIPGRRFSVKGAFAGIIWTTLFIFASGFDKLSPAIIASAFLALPAASAYYALSFTGCTPFTSRSGVKKEMRTAMPLMGIFLLLGLVLALAGLFS